MGLFDFFKKNEKDALGNTIDNPIGGDSYGSDSSSIGDAQPLSGRGYFRMVIEDVFTITGRGTVVTGMIETGEVRRGDEVIVERKTGETIKTKVTGVEQFRKLLDSAHAGDQIGLLLANIQRGQVESGDVVTK